MQNLPSEAKMLPLNRLLIPGTHDSGTVRLDFSRPIGAGIWFKAANVAARILPCVGGVIKDWTVTQQWEIAGQLEQGIRFFDLRVDYYSGNNQFYITHTFTACPLQKVINAFKDFLSETEQEVLLLEISPEWYGRARMTPAINDRLLSLIRQELGNWLCPPEKNGLWDSITIEALARKGKRLLVYFSGQTHTVFDFLWNPAQLHIPWNNTSTVQVQEAGLVNNLASMVRSDSELNGLYFTLTPQTQDVVQDVARRIFTPCCYQPKSILSLTRSIQGYLDCFIEGHREEIKSKNALFITDFPTEEFIQKVIDLNKRSNPPTSL